MTWADLFKLKAHAARAVIPYFVYLFTGVGFATCSAVLVQSYAPQAFHTGIPGTLQLHVTDGLLIADQLSVSRN